MSKRQAKAGALRVMAVALIVFWLAPMASDGAISPLSANPGADKPRVVASMLKAAMSFEANHGQTDPSVQFLARGSGYTLFLTPTESVMVLQQRETKNQKGDLTAHDPFAMADPTPIKHAVVRMKLEGANPSPLMEGVEPLPGIVNYFIGNDPAKWRTKIPTYAKVNYQEVYPGIDVAYYGNQGRLEYDFIVAPGADPTQIKLAFEGASDIRVADGGDLLLMTALGDVRMQKPVVYQLEKDGHKTLVAGQYVALSESSTRHASRATSHEIGIQLAAYDHAKPLVIDPVLAYSTHLGGSGHDHGTAIAVDSYGAAIVSGYTKSLDFPTLNAIQGTYGGGTWDAFVTKFDAVGGRVYSTYLGGNATEWAYGIAVDHAGAAYVTGYTTSTTFPTLNASQAAKAGGENAFVTKLDSAGALAYSTYLGGAGFDRGFGIAVDGTGAAYVTGSTSSAFPMLNASQGTYGGGDRDAFVAKLDPAGVRVYSTYLGGTAVDTGGGIAVDGVGAVYVTGLTDSTNFPILNGSQPTYGGQVDAFVAKFDAVGGRVYSTYLGGLARDEGNAIAVDGTSAVYVTGQTFSTNFPTLNAIQTASSGSGDAFVTKLDASGAQVYSTYLGGVGSDRGKGIAVDPAGAAHIIGITESFNFPILNAIKSTYTLQDAFVTKLNAAGALAYSTFLGGYSSEFGEGIALDHAGSAYVVGSTQLSQNFPMVNASQGTNAGGFDAFVAKIVDRPTANAGPDQSVPEGTLVTLDGSGSVGGSLTYQWTYVSGPAVSLASATTAHPTFGAPHVPAAGGTVTLQLIVCEGSSSNCSDPDTVNVHVTNINQPPVAEAGPDQTVQESSAVMLDGTASYDPDIETLSYQWTQILGPAVTLMNANTATPFFTAPSVGAGGATLVFDLTVTDPHLLTGSDSVAVNVTNVNQIPVAHAGADQTRNEHTLVTLDGSASYDPDLDALSYTWTQTGGPSVVLTGGSGPSPTFTAPEVGPGGALITFQLVVHDGHASSVADAVQIVVQNVNDPPVCTLAQAGPNLLWPPNHTMVPVSVTGITDPDNHAVTITYTAVTQDEPINGLGDGDMSPDAAVSGNNILLRAERAGTGNGRVYVVHFTATDAEGAHCSGTVRVSVPHSKKDPAGEGAQLYNSFGP